jgi:hypothetical protein
MKQGAWKLAALLLGLAVMPVLHVKIALADTVKIAHSTWVGIGLKRMWREPRVQPDVTERWRARSTQLSSS